DGPEARVTGRTPSAQAAPATWAGRTVALTSPCARRYTIGRALLPAVSRQEPEHPGAAGAW
ncbi:hypothetical protein, partial [Streptomyces sp. NPDC056242]|uniref:hypothetical protein n=1 Tax=Streptomyces sp. NPDC056242 TaxID=3345760 RepID=UPI0035DBCC57